MEFTNQFHVPLPLEEAWKLLLDVPRIMPCLPGAKLTEVVGPDKYKGAVTVKLGPVALTFNGQAELVKRDDENHVAWLKGSGTDPKGRGGAQSEFSFALVPAGTGTDVTVSTKLLLSGAVAQYGRGTGMISEVAAQILKQFEKNLAKSFGQEGVAAPAPTPVAAADAPVPPLDGADVTAASIEAERPATPVPAAPAAPVRTVPVQDAEPAPELNMLAIGLKAFWRSLLRSLGLGKK